MSGHSKWSSIKHKKAVTDQRRGKRFSKLANLITVAARSGKDSDSNAALRLAIEKAKQAEMPKENIERAIKRGTGEIEGAELEEVSYEAYAPGGAGVIIEAVTDNKNRTLSEIRRVLTAQGGKLAENGSVSYLFSQKGLIVADGKGVDVDELSLAMIDAGALDIWQDEGKLYIETKPEELMAVRNVLGNYSATVESAQTTKVAEQQIELKEEDRQKLLKMLEALDSLDDVTEVSTNAKL